MTLQYQISGAGQWYTCQYDAQPKDDNGNIPILYRILKDDGTVWASSREGIASYNEALNMLHRARRLVANNW